MVLPADFDLVYHDDYYSVADVIILRIPLCYALYFIVLYDAIIKFLLFAHLQNSWSEDHYPDQKGEI